MLLVPGVSTAFGAPLGGVLFVVEETIADNLRQNELDEKSNLICWIVFCIFEPVRCAFGSQEGFRSDRKPYVSVQS